MLPYSKVNASTQPLSLLKRNDLYRAYPGLASDVYEFLDCASRMGGKPSPPGGRGPDA